MNDRSKAIRELVEAADRHGEPGGLERLRVAVRAVKKAKPEVPGDLVDLTDQMAYVYAEVVGIGYGKCSVPYDHDEAIEACARVAQRGMERVRDAVRGRINGVALGYWNARAGLESRRAPHHERVSAADKHEVALICLEAVNASLPTADKPGQEVERAKDASRALARFLNLCYDHQSALPHSVWVAATHLFLTWMPERVEADGASRAAEAREDTDHPDAIERHGHRGP